MRTIWGKTKKNDLIPIEKTFLLGRLCWKSFMVRSDKKWEQFEENPKKWFDSNRKDFFIGKTLLKSPLWSRVIKNENNLKKIQKKWFDSNRKDFFVGKTLLKSPLWSGVIKSENNLRKNQKKWFDSNRKDFFIGKTLLKSPLWSGVIKNENNLKKNQKNDLIPIEKTFLLKIWCHIVEVSTVD